MLLGRLPRAILPHSYGRRTHRPARCALHSQREKRHSSGLNKTLLGLREVFFKTRTKSILLSRSGAQQYGRATMTRTLLPELTAMALASVAMLRQALANHETRDARRSSRWRQDLAVMLEADLINLDSVMRGFTVAEPARSP